MDKNLTVQSKRKRTGLIIGAAIVLMAVVISLPPVWSRVSYHYREVYRTVKYWINPPSEAVFVPSTLDDEPEVTADLRAINSFTPTPQPTSQPTTQPTSLPTNPISEETVTPTPEPTPTLTPIPLPESVLLTGISCERQFMNNCGPATLSMNLSFYDWGKNQLTTGAVLRPNSKDVNVMPYELADFVNNQTEFRALWRYGGDLQTIKTLLNAGFPVIIEKGFHPYSLRNDGWLGHYNLVVGYDDNDKLLTMQDSYLMSYPPWGGEIPPNQFDTFTGFTFYYTEIEQAWRAFNYVFVVVYPSDKENEVLEALGPLASQEGAYRIAYERAVQEASSLTDVREKFFALYNTGVSLVGMEDYAGAASAFDTAFELYPDIALDSRPYRMLWYQTDPYPAYYHSGRYQDVIKLADQTLNYMAEPVLEESYYWRAMSYHALGDRIRALEDVRTSLIYHPGYAPSEELLEQLTQSP